MKKLVVEWVKKAEGDAGTAKREAKVKEVGLPQYFSVRYLASFSAQFLIVGY